MKAVDCVQDGKVQHALPTVTRYVVETRFLGDTWRNTWRDADGLLLTFATYTEAERALSDHIDHCMEAMERNVFDISTPAELRLVAY